MAVVAAVAPPAVGSGGVRRLAPPSVRGGPAVAGRRRPAGGDGAGVLRPAALPDRRGGAGDATRRCRHRGAVDRLAAAGDARSRRPAGAVVGAGVPQRGRRLVAPLGPRTRGGPAGGRPPTPARGGAS